MTKKDFIVIAKILKDFQRHKTGSASHNLSLQQDSSRYEFNQIVHTFTKNLMKEYPKNFNPDKFELFIYRD